MEIKVREVGFVEQKSVQEIEQELLNKHEDQQNKNINIEADKKDENINLEVDKIKSSEMNEEEILEYIGNKYGKKINSLEEFTREREEAEPLPEDVAAYFKYKKETGRGIEDFVKINRGP
jgi:subtilase family serine protease